jgi:hypothetical protein
MTEVLSEKSGLGEGLDALKDAATTRFRKARPQGLDLTMVGVGWDPKPDGSFVPFYATISNVIINELPKVREKGPTRDAYAVAVMRSGPTRPVFDWYAVAMQPWLSCLVHIAGQPMAKDQVDRLVRNLRRAVLAEAKPIALIRLIAEEVWAVAATNPYVGTSLMAVSLPRAAARRSGQVSLVSGPPQADEITAMYLPGLSTDPIYYQPNLAGAGACFIDATIEPL